MVNRLKVLVVALLVAAVAVGCGGGGSGSGGAASNENKTLTLGNIGWTENIAVDNLTKVIFEEELGYENVKIQTAGIGPVFQGVGGGEIQAFQDVWMPNHEQYINEIENDSELLDPWFDGQTRYSMAVPSYMEAETIADLADTGAEEIIGIEPGLPMTEAINDKAIPQYDLPQEQVVSSTAGMLSEIEKRFENEEEFAFVAWSPHWMNEVYDFRYLEDPEGALGDLTKPSELATVVNEDLESDDPVAYAFMQEFTLTEEQLNALMTEIRNADDDPVKGSKAWLEKNRDLADPWIQAAEDAA